MAKGVKKTITATKNYRLFHRSEENRALDLKKHRKLYDSMKLYGFLACFPIVCVRDSKGDLIVKDGQHRLAIANELGLPVYYIESTEDFDVAVINCTPKTWALRDYAEKFASNGLKCYQEGIDFSDRFNIAIGTAFALLAGNTSFTNCKPAFIGGTFKVRDREWAERVAAVFSSACALSKQVNNERFILACMAACRVKEFDAARFLHGAERCREKLVAYSTRDAYLDMMEEIYNFNRARKNLVALKILAVQTMRDRAANEQSKQRSKATQEAA
jgi:hypothetical protein